jgi:hypothetical protein
MREMRTLSRKGILMTTIRCSLLALTALAAAAPEFGAKSGDRPDRERRRGALEGEASRRGGSAMTRKRLWLPLIGFVFISFASPWHAYGFDYKIHPGSLCQPSLGDEAARFIRGPGFIYHGDVSAREPLTVTCPLIRDRVPHEGPAGPGERGQLDVGIRFSRLVPIGDQAVVCRFHAVDLNGVEVFVSPPQSTNPNVENQSLFWAVKPEQTAVEGTYNIVCQLPAYIAVLHYSLGEDKETNNPF